MQQLNENQEKLLKLVKEIILRPGNINLKKDLEKILFADSILEHNQLSKELHKLYSHEAYIAQAHEFYRQFWVDENLKKELINDYVKMIFFFHSGDFEKFALACFQQIEALVNFLFDDLNNQGKIQEHLTKICYSFRNKNYTLKNLLFHNSNDKLNAINTWSIRIKIKTILHFYSLVKYINKNFEEFYLNFLYGQKNYKKKAFFDLEFEVYKYYDFKKKFEEVDYIYLARNIIHRENEEANLKYNSDFQNKHIEEIKQNPFKTSIKILQYFNNFMLDIRYTLEEKHLYKNSRY